MSLKHHFLKTFLTDICNSAQGCLVDAGWDTVNFISISAFLFNSLRKFAGGMGALFSLVPSPNKWWVNLRAGEGGGITLTPVFFSGITEKRQCAAPPFVAYLIHQFRILQKILGPDIQVTRLGWSSHPTSKICRIVLWLQCLCYLYETFRSWLRHQYLQNEYLGIFVFGDLRSGQF